jgi:hypothetical protein
VTYKQLIQFFHVVTTSFMHFNIMLHSGHWLKSTNVYVVGQVQTIALQVTSIKITSKQTLTSMFEVQIDY